MAEPQGKSAPTPAPTADRPAAKCRTDFSITCPSCLVAMVPVHSHYQCTRCGWRDSCCF